MSTGQPPIVNGARFFGHRTDFMPSLYCSFTRAQETSAEQLCDQNVTLASDSGKSTSSESQHACGRINGCPQLFRLSRETKVLRTASPSQASQHESSHWARIFKRVSFDQPNARSAMSRNIINLSSGESYHRRLGCSLAAAGNFSFMNGGQFGA